ncbi:hypothetical protein ACFQ9J_17630 [Streptomyces sp. NPDC056529]|uniref:hypothetical protein n=1 Tax=Streptomyces sp. NPDC056529 TaxID=3345855 RepID=UPI0036BAA24F
MLRENNTYQVEYWDGVREQHFQTMTVSQKKVLGALLGWARSKPDWRNGFMWNNIGEQFNSGDGEPPEQVCGTKPSMAPEAV